MLKLTSSNRGFTSICFLVQVIQKCIRQTQGGVTQVQRGAITKIIVPQALMHNIIHKIQKSHIAPTIKQQAWTIQDSQKYGLRVLIGQCFVLKIPMIPFLPSTLPNGQRNHPPHPMNPTILYSSSPSRHHIFDWWSFKQLTAIKKRDNCQRHEAQWHWMRRWFMVSSSSRHIEHLIGPLKFLLSSTSSIEIFPLYPAKQKSTFS